MVIYPRELRVLQIAVWGYAAATAGLWLAIEFLVDRVWAVTLFAFGPRWLAAIPLLPLGAWAVFAARHARYRRRVFLLLGTLSVTACLIVFGVCDLRLGLRRTSGVANLKVMTLNLGGSYTSAEALDLLMRGEQIDVAALQECPFFDYGPARLGWRFFYGGNLCLVSRFPFTVLDVANPDTVWTRNSREPMRFQIEHPAGAFQLLNVHLETIRGGLEGGVGNGLGAYSRLVGNRSEARQQSRRARNRLRSTTMPVIVLGDFNLPAESVIYRESWGDLANAFGACGRGFGHTKFTGHWGVRIDHVITSDAWRCLDAHVLHSPYGGDHAPLVATLRRR
jgi:endonuclease/exonuclease/phosphatase family metal-dependent hydrolase